MSNLQGALDLMLNLKGTQATISRPGTILTATIKIAPSNYQRNLEVSNNIISTGREYVISRALLDAAGYPFPKRADRLNVFEVGILTIAEIIEMYDIGGVIMAWRCRTN